MARKTGAPAGSSPTDMRSRAAGLGSRLGDSWLGRNWHTVLIVLMIMFLALFVRAYFAYSVSVDHGFAVSGGSDSYYHMWCIEHVMETGQNLYRDPMLNYPFGMRNPRPPLYDWSVAVGGMMLEGLGLERGDAVGYSLIFSTAIWGTLTVIPVYLFGRAAFNNKAGIIAAFLFALMPGHIQRSVLSNADHDAMVLFFGVWSFYFLLMALKQVRGDKWVSSWGSLSAIRSGLRNYVSSNKVSLIYAAMSGLALAAVAMMWTGFTYMLVIVLAFLLVELFINRFKNLDSTGLVVTVGVMLATAFAVMAPLYYQMNYWRIWFDIPFYLFLTGMVVSLIFVVTRDYPWTLVIPSFIIIAGVGLLALSAFMPDLFEAIITGQGYFVQSKLYSTISEAQPPQFSNLVLSFGAVTFWLSFVGLFWAAMRVPRNLSHYFVFVVVWTGVSMFMAVSAARFMFNAAPAFAITAGWILAIIIEKLDFRHISRNLSGIKGNPLTILRKAIKVRHVLGAFFLVALILLPNVWFAVDAGIPYDLKKQYDRQVSSVMPDFLKPDDYEEDGIWYFGAFSYSLPKPGDYWPEAWNWFSEQDSDVYPLSSRPAFLSWWDYGFEAIQAGRHPTVADNFQNAYQFAGSFITAQNETAAIALLVTRTLEKTGTEDPVIVSMLEDHGVEVSQINDILVNPSRYVEVVKNHPDIYGPYDAEISAENAKYAAATVELSKIGKSRLVDLYHDLRQETGIEIGYFAVDSRLFPFSAQRLNIFYAPVKLSDHRIDDFNQPIDFYEILAVDSQGRTHTLENVTRDMVIVDYTLQYKEMFYNSMLYRTFMGYGPEDIGRTGQGIPGFSGSLQDLPPMQGWNLTHFRMVYRTAYYNPFPEEMVADHPDAWRAISYEEGIYLMDKIEAGEAEGVVDLGPHTLQSGVVFLQYYEGAIIRGQAVTESGEPYPNVWVTALDEYGIPHDTVRTDSEGYYELVAPFGEIEVVYSYGDLDLRRQIAVELDREAYNITYAQAMREKVDSNKDGFWDYLIDGDITLPGTDVTGRVYWDLDGDGEFSSIEDSPITDAIFVIEDLNTGQRREAEVDGQGAVVFNGLPPMDALIYALVDGRAVGERQEKFLPMGDRTVEVAIEPSGIKGTLVDAEGRAVVGEKVMLEDLISGNERNRTTAANGSFSFDMLLPGNYSLRMADQSISMGKQIFNLGHGTQVEEEFVVEEAITVSGQAMIGGLFAANAVVGLYSDTMEWWVTADERGRFSFVAPAGEYTLRCIAVRDGVEYSSLQSVSESQGDLKAVLGVSSVIRGRLTIGDEAVRNTEIVFESQTSGAYVRAVTNSTGGFRISVPAGWYTAYAESGIHVYWNDLYLSETNTISLSMSEGVSLTGKVWYDADHDSQMDQGEGMPSVGLRITDREGRSIGFETNATGDYGITLLPDRSYHLTVSRAGYEVVEIYYDRLTGSEVQNIKMVAINRTVSGQAVMGSSGLPGIEVQFRAASPGAVTTSVVTGPGGMFSLSVAPGSYQVIVDQNVTVGSDQVKYQHSSALEVKIGQDLEPLVLDVVERVRLQGQVLPDRVASAQVSFIGPEMKELSVDVDFDIYLIAGEYDVYVMQREGAYRYAYLDRLVIDATTSPLTLNTQTAYLLSGTLRYGASPFLQQADVTITRDSGANLTVTTGVTGSFQATLPIGDYTVSVDHRTIDRVNNQEKYLRYFASLDLEMTSSVQKTIDLEREYDNSTVSGAVISPASVKVPATLSFTAIDQTAIDLEVSVTQAGFSLSLAPGNYSLYAREIGGTGVFLGPVEVAPYEPQTLNVQLDPGLRLSGVTSYGGRDAPANLTIRGEAEVSLTSGAGGAYEIYLPRGEYRITADAVSSERGVTVDYEATFTVNLTESASHRLLLNKVERRSVQIDWVSAEKIAVKPGGEVLYTIRVINTGNVPDTFRLSATTDWEVSFSQDTVSLDFGTMNSQLVNVALHVPTNAVAKDTSVTVRAASTVDSSATASEKLDVTVLPIYAVNLSFAKAYPTSGQDQKYSLKVDNKGNTESTFLIRVANGEELVSLGWDFFLGNQTEQRSIEVTVAALGSGQFDLTLLPIRANPNPNAVVVLVAGSLDEEDVYDSYSLEVDIPVVVIPDGGMTVDGEKVSFEPPTTPLSTIVLAGLAGVLTVIVILMGIQRGLFKRRKKR